MPTILRIGLYRFFFYSNEGNESPHIHVESNGKIAKFWLKSVRLQHSGGFSRTEIGKLRVIVHENQEYILKAWNEYFNG